MDFATTESQTLLLDSARSFFEQHLPGEVLQSIAEGKAAAPFEENLWNGISELGWPGILVPDDQGGFSGGAMDAVLLIEQFGYSGAPGPFIGSAIAATSLLVSLGCEAQKAARLPAMAQGKHRLALAVAEGSGEYDLASVKLTADNGSQLSGAKHFVYDADRADEIVVVYRTGASPGQAELAVALVPREAAVLTRLDTLSNEPLFEVRLDGWNIDSDATLGSPGQAENAMERSLALGALARTAEMVGLANRALDICVEYTKIREQSGQPIGAFQAIQHHCADMLRHLEGTRYATYRAAWDWDEESDWRMSVARAKAYGGEACLALVRKVHQVMGAIGYCEEHPLHYLHKRIHAAALDFGDATAHLDAIAASMD